jgi:hypothetical protein
MSSGWHSVCPSRQQVVHERHVVVWDMVEPVTGTRMPRPTATRRMTISVDERLQPQIASIGYHFGELVPQAFRFRLSRCTEPLGARQRGPQRMRRVLELSADQGLSSGLGMGCGGRTSRLA